MPFITFEAPNLWEQSCYEVQTGSTEIPLRKGGSRYDSSIHNPVFAGYAFQKVENGDSFLLRDFDSALAHPSSVGFIMEPLSDSATENQVHEYESVKTKELDPKKCSAVTYISEYLFPIISPALEAMLAQAKTEKCFERKRTKFNACDFISEYLYKNNPSLGPKEREKRSDLTVFDIPFAVEWLKDHPRKPLPKSLIWTEEEAAVVLQSAIRGFLVRCNPEVQELRQWQREWREENKQVLDGEIEKLFSRAQSRASSSLSTSRPPSKRLSSSRHRSGLRRSGSQSASVNPSQPEFVAPLPHSFSANNSPPNS